MQRILLHDASIHDGDDGPCSAEITDPSQRKVFQEQLDRERLKAITSSTEDFEGLSKLRKEHSRLSLPDCSVVYWAAKHFATVLSGDALLRRVATERGLHVHGTLWIFESLVELRLLTPAHAARALKELMSINDRLPRHECESCVERWLEQQ